MCGKATHVSQWVLKATNFGTLCLHAVLRKSLFEPGPSRKLMDVLGVSVMV